MWILIALFLISLAVIAGIISYKTREIRRGEAEVRSNVPTPDYLLPKINLNLVQARTLGFLGKYSHFLVLLFLKLRIKLTYFIKRKKEAIMPKIEKNKFLKNISDYKKRLKKIEQKMKESEENK